MSENARQQPTVKLYAWTPCHFFLLATLMCANASGVKVEIVCPDEAMAKTPEFIKKKAHGKYPVLETSDGKILYETNAICGYLLRLGGK